MTTNKNIQIGDIVWSISPYSSSILGYEFNVNKPWLGIVLVKYGNIDNSRPTYKIARKSKINEFAPKGYIEDNSSSVILYPEEIYYSYQEACDAWRLKKIEELEELELKVQKYKEELENGLECEIDRLKLFQD